MSIKPAIPTVPSVATSGEGKAEDEYLKLKLSVGQRLKGLDIA